MSEAYLIKSSKKPGPGQIRPLIVSGISSFGFTYLALKDLSSGSSPIQSALVAALSAIILIAILAYNGRQVIAVSEKAIHFKGDVIPFSDIESLILFREKKRDGELREYQITLKNGLKKILPGHFWQQDKVDWAIKSKLQGRIPNIDRLMDL